MKRKVACGVQGNFRRVCPILNRAAAIPDTVCVLNCGCMPAGKMCVCACPPRSIFEGFFYGDLSETHGGVCIGKTRPMLTYGNANSSPSSKIYQEAIKKWQSMKRSGSRSKVTTML